MSRGLLVCGICALAAVACGKSSSEPEQPSAASGAEAPPSLSAAEERCAAQVDEDGDTIVSSEADDYVFVLGGPEWELSCVPGETMALTATYAGFTVAVVSLANNDAPDVLRDFANGVQKGLQKTTNYAPVDAGEEKLGEDGRSALCFKGPATHEGTGLHVEGCVSSRRSSGGKQVLSSVTWVGPQEALAEAGTQVSEGVRALTTSWLLLSEIPADTQ
jgi:hypothetical protein